MTAGRPSRGGRAALCRAAMGALVALGVLVGAASGAFAQNQPQPTTPTTSPTTTPTTAPPPPPPPPPPTTAPPTTQETAPPATEEPPPPQDDDSGVEPVVDEEQPVEEEAEVAADASDAQGITFTTVNDLLVPGDGTEGAQATTTTTAPQPDEGSSADDENRLIWMIIAGLAAVAVIVAVLTWRYWLLTRPGLVLEGEDADDVRRGGTGLGYGDARSGQRSPPGGRGGNDAFWDEPRDPRRAFVGPPDPGGAPSPPPAPGAPHPGRQDAGAGTGGTRRRRAGPGGPGGPRGPGGPAGQGGGPAGQGGRGGPPSNRSAWPPGSPGQEDPKRRRRNPGAGPPQGRGGPQAAGERRRRGQPGAGSSGWVNDVGPGGARRVVGHASGGGRVQPPARPQPIAGRSMRDTDIWAPDRRRGVRDRRGGTVQPHG
jgi:hypothetical protein